MPDAVETVELERGGAISRRGAAGDVSEKVGLACANGAGAVPPQLFERIVGLVTVVPDDGELAAENLEELDSHAELRNCGSGGIIHATG